MIFDKFRKEFLEFLEKSNVNLGRKDTKTRLAFLKEAGDRFSFFATIASKTNKTVAKKEEINSNDGGRLVCMKPKDKRRALDGGKGTVMMTGSESQRADEELNRSPYTKKQKDKE